MAACLEEEVVPTKVVLVFFQMPTQLGAQGKMD